MLTAGHASRDNVESSGKADDVELPLLAIGDNALLGEFLDRCAARLVDTDDVDVLPVQSLVVVLREC